MNQAEFDVPLVTLYRERGLIGLEDPPRARHLPTQCPQSQQCWPRLLAADVPGADMDQSELSPPWIGPRYRDGETAIVLENLRNYGGFDLRVDATKGMRKLGWLARQQLGEGRRRLFGGGTYRGTDVWPRALAYAAIWLDALGVLPAGGAKGAPSPAVLSAALEHVAILQHVKCSPKSAKSEQSAAMWQRCGRHVLADELAILRPLRVLVLGTGDNARAMEAHVLRGASSVVGRGTIPVGGRQLAITRSTTATPWGAVDLLVAPHPAGKGGNSRKLPDLLRHLLGAVGAVNAVPPAPGV